MLTQANLIAAGAGLLGAGIHLNPQDTHVSYLPLAHVYERIVQVREEGGAGRTRRHVCWHGRRHRPRRTRR